MSTESRDLVLDIHKSLGVNAPSQLTIQNMSIALDIGSVTAPCLRASLIRSDAYRVSVRSRYRGSCYALLGEDDEVSFKLFDAALTKAHSEPIEVEDADINLAVRWSARFESRYVDVVRRNYSTLMNGEQPSEEFTAAMVAKFRDDPTFTLDDLHVIIRSLPVPSLNPIARPSGEESTGGEAPFDIHTHTMTALAMSMRAPAPAPQVDTADPETIRQILLVADRVFGRPWFALELVAYISVCAVIKDPIALHAFVSSLLDEHAAAWEQARSAHAHLLGDVLEEIDFVRKYVGKHRAPGFSASLPGDILASPTYEQRITNRLAVVQKRLYDVALEDEELSRIFVQARTAALGVADDDVAILLHDHRRECDALVSEVVGVYVEILNREPNHMELADDIKVFRDGGAVVLSEQPQDAECLTSMRMELAVRLSKGFEFHDVIKTRLRSAYHQAHGGVHVPIQALYIMLERVLMISESTIRSRGCVNGVAAIVDQEIRRTSEASI